MSSHQQNTKSDTSSVHLPPELKDLISNSKYVGPKFNLETLVNLFASIHLHEFPVIQPPKPTRMTEGREEVEGLWLVILTGAIFALNAVEAIPTLYQYAIEQTGGDEKNKLFVAERMREVGLKTVSFMGVPRAINCLAALTAAIKDQTPGLKELFPTESRRELTPENLDLVQSRGRELWDDIYAPHHEKLLAILGKSHPDLPTHIVQCHYSALLAPFPASEARPTDLNRVESSVLAVTCLRALGGVERQVESHLFGLRKAPPEWVTSDEGCLWLLKTVDEVVDTCRGIPRT